MMFSLPSSFISGYNASTGPNLTLNNASCGVYSRTNNAVISVADLGGVDGSGNGISYNISNSSATEGCRLNANSNISSAAIPNSIAYISMSRTTSTTTNAYRNGSLVTAISQTTTSQYNGSLYILATSSNGTAGAWTTRQLAFVYFGSGSISQSSMNTDVNILKIYLGW